MLIALDEKDRPLYAEQAQKRSRMNAGGTYYCPCCKGRVMFKSGEYMSAHFAHYHAENCAAFTEGETAAHLKGKRMLLEKFRGEGLPVVLESWLPELTQRPDLVDTPRFGKTDCDRISMQPHRFCRFERTNGRLSAKRLSCLVDMRDGLSAAPPDAKNLSISEPFQRRRLLVQPIGQRTGGAAALP